MMIRPLYSACVLTAALTASATAADPPRFETHVRQILKTHCWHCHGEEEEPEASLDLRLVRLMMAGGDSGTAIVPGKPEDSLLYQRLHDGEMPPDESKLLSADELAVIRDWIADGAHTVRPEPESAEDAPFITEEERAHWSFQPIVRPAVPEVSNTDLLNNPVDAFLLATLEEKGFAFSPRAAPHTLVRRLYLDLHGLPPTPDDVRNFQANPDQSAWQQLVTDLLDSDRYGERWARHWLDVAGYADSEGYNDADAERPHAWRYRDYVIRSFNQDKPFDRFIHEQLAGDEMITSPRDNLSKQDTELLAATGFLRMAPDGTGGAVDDANVARNETIADTIKIVSSSLMAMTVGCAQCHDHRYDPVSHEDYFRFRAIFEPAFDWQKWRSPRQRLVSLYTDADRAAAAKIEAEAKQIDAERAKKQQQFIQDTFEKQLAKLPADLHDAAREAHQTDAKKRTEEQQALFRKHPNLNVTAGSLYLYDKKAADELADMADQAKKLRATKPKEEFVRALTEVPGRVPATHLFHRGDHEQPKQELSPGGLSVVSANCELNEIPVNADGMETTGRRLAFAKRLTSGNHPLTARALVNRVWLQHFGRGLVTTPGDFGVLGQKPSHPELLDWLAAEFMDSGWSLKHLHRLILTSNAWQQQLRNDAALQQADPDNEWYGGARLRRLDAEVVRDSMLALSGRLNDKAFGPPVPVMADRVGRFVIGKENLNAGRPGAVIDMKGEQFRRSIYVQVRRSRPLSVLDTFDQPIMSPNCDMRRPSTSSTQSLLMLNSDLLVDFSRFLADRLEREAGADALPRIELAWQLVFSRPPEHSEKETAARFLQDQAAIFSEQPAYQPDAKKPAERTAQQEALALMCQMLLGSNEFLYTD
ncbi:MAG: PSD1 and planctomycete cytochrome C domain-containing protein [Fuerstiella sp.]